MSPFPVPFRTFSATAGLLMLAIAIPFSAAAQAQAAGSQAPAPAPATPATSAAGKLTFEVASVRPSTRKFVGIGMDFLNPLSDEAPPKGGLFSWNVPFISLVDFAYDIRTIQEGRSMAESLPKWAQMPDGWFTIEARADGNPTRADVRAMVRSLLEDRFQFAGHMETRDGQVYALVVDKPGPGLKPHPDGAPCALSSSQTDENTYPHAYPGYKSVPARCGVFNRELSHFGERRLEMLDVTMQQITGSVAMFLPLPVIDKTGLTGRYDAVLDVGPGGIPPQNADSSDSLGLPPPPAALEKQLGLKLVKQNGPVDVFVIDHIGTLTEN